MKLSSDKLTGPQKAAILFLTMGEDFSINFFKELDEASIKKIGKYMEEITHIPSDVLNAVIDDYLAYFKNDGDIVVSGKDLLKKIVNKSLDKERANEVFKVIDRKDDGVPFSELTHIPTDHLISIMREEHPQTIALILSYLPCEKAAEVLKVLPEELKNDVALRIVQIGRVDLEVVKELDKVMKSQFSKIGGTTRKCDGIETLANILNRVDGKTKESVLSHIKNENVVLADIISIKKEEKIEQEFIPLETFEHSATKEI